MAAGRLPHLQAAACRMQDLVEQLGKQLQDGRRIYAHCWGGRGRAGTLGACLLGYLYGLSAEEALMQVQRAFDTRTEIGRPCFLSILHAGGLPSECLCMTSSKGCSQLWKIALLSAYDQCDALGFCCVMKVKVQSQS